MIGPFMFRMYVTVTRLSNNRLLYLGDQDLMTSLSSSQPRCPTLRSILSVPVGCELIWAGRMRPARSRKVHPELSGSRPKLRSLWAANSCEIEKQFHGSQEFRCASAGSVVVAEWSDLASRTQTLGRRLNEWRVW